MRMLAPGLVAFACAAAGAAEAGPDTHIRCDNLSTAELAIDGLLDEWTGPALARIGAPADGAIDLRCSWDGTALAVAVDIKDQRVVRVRSGAAHEDKVDIVVGAGGAPVRISVLPGTAIAKAKIAAPPRVAVADALQPKGFAIEARIPAAAIDGLSASTPSLDLRVVFDDSDMATGGSTQRLELTTVVELGDRKDLLDDFLRAVKLRRTDVRLDALAELDPDRKGKERVVAGGTAIGVLTDQFAYVTLPAAKPADVKKVELLPLGPRDQQVIAAVVRQSGNGGSRDLLMLWVVAAGKLQPLAQLEVRKEMGANVLESAWRIGKGARGPELLVEPRPAVGFTQATWNEEPATDADPIVSPWDGKAGVGYTLAGTAVLRRDLPKKK
ncbi:MAG: hypothetical protein KIT31_29085 [Deltaproteobacteria bacterium]|nr:hypothetical protein [Deltaproteobacteria bacterium]